jgi:hypothetical protein
MGIYDNTKVDAGLATTLSASTALNALASVAGRSAVLIGPTIAGYGSITTGDMYKVGAVDGTVSVANNQEVVKLQSSALQNPYAAINTAYDFQVTFTLQEVDLPNISIALGMSAATAASAIDITNTDFDSLGGDDDAATINKWANYTDLGAANPAPYRSMRIVTLGAQLTDGTVEHMGWDFYKVKIVSQGTIDFDRTANISLPVTAHCLGIDADVVGRVWHTNALATEDDRGYDG